MEYLGPLQGGSVVYAKSFILALLFTLTGALAVSAEPIELDDVIRLLEAGVGERVVIAQIEANGVGFDLSTEEILALKEEGVPESVIEALIHSSGVREVGDELAYSEEGEEERSEVPAELGFSRYDAPSSVEIALVPYAVPRVSYVYDPWYWDYFWYDPWYYVSWTHPYRYGYYGCFYPYHGSGLYVSYHYGHHYYPNHHYNGYHGNHHYATHQNSRSAHYSDTRASYGKTKYRTGTTERVATSRGSTYNKGSRYRTERYAPGGSRSTTRDISGTRRTGTIRPRGTSDGKATRGTATKPSLGGKSRSGKESAPQRTYKPGSRSAPKSSAGTTRNYQRGGSGRSGGGKATTPRSGSSGSKTKKGRR